MVFSDPLYHGWHPVVPVPTPAPHGYLEQPLPIGGSRRLCRDARCGRFISQRLIATPATYTRWRRRLGRGRALRRAYPDRGARLLCESAAGEVRPTTRICPPGPAPDDSTEQPLRKR